MGTVTLRMHPTKPNGLQQCVRGPGHPAVGHWLILQQSHTGRGEMLRLTPSSIVWPSGEHWAQSTRQYGGMRQKELNRWNFYFAVYPLQLSSQLWALQAPRGPSRGSLGRWMERFRPWSWAVKGSGQQPHSVELSGWSSNPRYVTYWVSDLGQVT